VKDMAIIFGVLAIICLGMAIHDCCKMNDDGREMWLVLFCVNVAIVGFIIGYNADTLLKASDCDARISMYEEQNAKIERQVSVAVDKYMSHETETFKNAKTESAITLVTLYPELKSDALISKLIDTYTSNNEKIVKLKNEKIVAHRARWWIYFGK
jgi:hypothetical protein